jgi:hypothetical protein
VVVDTGLTLVDLANFTGKESIYYKRFVVESLLQAGDLFELATGLTELPAEGLNLRLANRGVLSMAEALYEGQDSRDLRFSPFRTETIGTYSYSLAQNAVLQGIPTGVAWFDLAVSQLRSEPAIESNSIHVYDRHNDTAEVHGERILVGPADTNRFRGSPYTGRDSFVEHAGWEPDDWPFS